MARPGATCSMAHRCRASPSVAWLPVTGSESRPPAGAGTDRPRRERVGFAGLGIMGSRMAAHVARAGYPLTVYNRTQNTADGWAAEHDVAVAETPADLAI